MAYGARLESVLSESSQGFESPILRQSDPGVFRDRNVFAASLTNDLITPSPRNYSVASDRTCLNRRRRRPNVDARPEQGGSHELSRGSCLAADAPHAGCHTPEVFRGARRSIGVIRSGGQGR